MHQEPISFTNPCGERLSAIIHHPSHPSKKCVVICHGFAANKDRPWIIEMCDEMVRNGILSARLDFSGCGDSQGRLENGGYLKQVSELNQLITIIKQMGLDKIGVIGHSMGGADVILASAENNSINAVVAIAPVAYPTHEDHLEFAKAYFKEKGVPIDDKFFDGLDKVDIIGAAKKRTAPLLVIHGDCDDNVPVDEGRALFEEANEPKKMIIAIGAGHRLSSDQEFSSECRELSLTWMEKYL